MVQASRRSAVLKPETERVCRGFYTRRGAPAGVECRCGFGRAVAKRKGSVDPSNRCALRSNCVVIASFMNDMTTPTNSGSAQKLLSSFHIARADTVPQRVARTRQPGEAQRLRLPVSDARWETSIQFPSGSRTNEIRAVVPSVTGGRPSVPLRAMMPACSASTSRTCTVR